MSTNTAGILERTRKTTTKENPWKKVLPKSRALDLGYKTANLLLQLILTLIESRVLI